MNRERKFFKVHGEDDRLLTLLSVSPQRTTEVFQLTLDASGQGTLIWSIFKNKDGPYGLHLGSSLSQNVPDKLIRVARFNRFLNLPQFHLKAIEGLWATAK